MNELNSVVMTDTDAETTPRPSDEPIPPAERSKGPDGRVNILLVDDHTENLLALEAILSDLGENLIQATSGREALRHLLQNEFAVILLDVQMPGMDGFETAMLIRERDKLQHTPIIFLTAMDKNDTSIYKGYSVGAVDYIFKPFAPEVLKAKVSVFIELFKKTEEVKRQAELLRQTNRELGKTNKLLGGLYKEIEHRNNEIRRERDFIGRVLDTAGSFVLVFDAQGRIQRFNRACEEITGYTFEEVQGRYVWEILVAPEELEEAQERIRTGNYPTEREGTWVTKHGLRRTVAWSNSVLRDDNGAIGYFICTGIDVTERKMAEEEIRKLNEELEMRVLERTVQLQGANRELEKAKEAAEAANRAKDQFLAVLSHELRTPLNPVLATVHALEEEPSVTDELRPWIDIIRRNVELEARLIDDLLDLTRIAQGKLRLNIDTVDVHALLRNVVEICSVDLAQKGLELQLDLGATASHVLGDSARLQQVFWNLIKNAIKFTPERGTITVRSGNGKENRICVDVVDSGIGIERELLGRIFDAFEQGDQNITKRFGGLGLGLAISRTLIEVHGGSISASSEGKGRGATFSVELMTTDPVEGERGRDEGAEAKPARRDRMRILLVEDNTDTSQLMQLLLERRGFHVHASHTVADALAVAETGEYDLLISDIGLPDGSGIDLMRELRQRHRLPIKGIAVSGYGMEEDIARSREAGFAEHLTKPINFRHLQEVITKLMEA